MGAEEQDAAEKAAAHANTPTIIHTDTLARGFYTLQNDGINPLIHSYEVLDITGSRLAVVDGRGLTPLSYHYNMLQAPCYQQSLDSGSGRTLIDVAGQPLYGWDALDKQTEMEYDVLRRPLKRITDGKTLEQYIYGESLTSPEDHNCRGQVYRTYDGSGRQQVNEYDFKGNVLDTEQQLLDDPALTDADWSVLDDTDLSMEVFTSSVTYDALNRPVTTTDPGSNVHEFTYDKGGFLKKVKLNTDEYVKNIRYDAKGQRQAIWYGNGTKTSYTYDEFTFRLRRLLTVNVDSGNPHYNEKMQDLHYYYDPVGNITTIEDEAEQTLFYDNSIVAPTQKFTYDALYRLIKAKGRELIGTASFGTEDNWNDSPWQTTHKGDGNAVQNYKQKYTYDEAGNILELKHIAATGSYTRTYDIDTDSNRLLSTQVGMTPAYEYDYDTRGNMTEMHLDAMHWNVNNELHKIENGTMEAFYQYSGGQRVRKFVDKGSVKEERIYLGNFEIYRKFVSGVLDIERTTVHVSDDTGRIAMLETRTVGDAIDDNDTAEELTRYIYSNHLQSASLELDEDAEIISYEEYHPYGTTSYQAMNATINAVAKRYRYTGKERDEESGLYYHGARYYIPWLARWSAVDPLESKFGGRTPYCYGANNPVIYNDPNGEQEKSGNQPEEKKEGHTYIIRFADENHNIIDVPDGTEVEYIPFNGKNGGTPIYTVYDPYKGHQTLTAGKHVISEATGGAVTITTVLTYAKNWGVNEGTLSLISADQTFSRPPDFREGTQTTVEPVMGMIDEINLSISFQLNTNTSNGARFADPVSAQAQINALANQLQNMGIDNINLQVTSTYEDPDLNPIPNYRNAAALLTARFNTASNAFSAAGITVNRPANFTDPSLYGRSFRMTVQIPPTPGIVGWNVTTQTVQQRLDAYGNPVGDASIIQGGASATNFVPNNFDGVMPSGGTVWQPNPQPKVYRSLWVKPPAVKPR